MSKCSSSAITSSTVSSESAPRSSMNFALGVTSSSSTPSCSQMISFTFSSTALAISRSPPSGKYRIFEPWKRRLAPPGAAQLLLSFEPLKRRLAPPGAAQLLLPSHVQAAVDVEHLPRDIGGSVSGEESYHFRHLARGA